jgi:hypothetical protein
MLFLLSATAEKGIESKLQIFHQIRRIEAKQKQVKKPFTLKLFLP